MSYIDRCVQWDTFSIQETRGHFCKLFFKNKLIYKRELGCFVKKDIYVNIYFKITFVFILISSNKKIYVMNEMNGLFPMD